MITYSGLDDSYIEIPCRVLEAEETAVSVKQTMGIDTDLWERTIPYDQLRIALLYGWDAYLFSIGITLQACVVYAWDGKSMVYQNGIRATMLIRESERQLLAVMQGRFVPAARAAFPSFGKVPGLERLAELEPSVLPCVIRVRDGAQGETRPVA